MKNYLIIPTIFIGFLFLAFNPTEKKTQSAFTKKWQSDSIFQTPESVVYDDVSNFLYVSNISGKSDSVDGNGFISKVLLNGNIETLKWSVGLDGPKGMAIMKGKLYVADITKIVIIDIATGIVEKKIPVYGAKFLNDITIDKYGNIYISDSNSKKIFLLKSGKVTLWYDGTKTMKSPNGLLATQNGLKMVDMESGIFYNIDYKSKKLEKIAENIPSGDGIVELGKDQYIISGWSGELYDIMGSNVQLIMDTKQQKLNAADICYLSAEKLLIVPTFYGNKLIAYELNL